MKRGYGIYFNYYETNHRIQKLMKLDVTSRNDKLTMI